MENQTKPDQTTRLSLDEAQQEVDRLRQEAKATSKYASLDPGTAEEFDATGVMYKRHTTGTDPKSGAPYESDKIDVELSEVTPNGENRVLSFGANNKIVPELIKLLKSGERHFTLSRTGEGTSTRYALLTVKKKAPAAGQQAAPAAGQQ